MKIQKKKKILRVVSSVIIVQQFTRS